MKSNIKKFVMFLLLLLFTFLALPPQAGAAESWTPAPQQQPATAPGAIPQSLQEKMMRLHTLAQKRQQEGTDMRPAMEIAEGIHPLMEQQKFSEAEALVDRVLKLLGDSPTPGGTGTPGTCVTSGISASSGTTTLTSECQVNGNIMLSGTATLSMTGAVLSVAGKVVLNDQAQLTVTNGTLAFPQQLFGQYSLTLNNTARLTLNNSKLVTSGTSRHLTMTWNAHNASVVDVESSTLSTDGGNWLLGYFHDQSRLIMNNSAELPTEVYPSDAAQISISHSTLSDVVLEFMAGSIGTVDVPQRGMQGVNFDFGNSPGFDYSIQLVSTKTRLTFGSHPNSSMTVKGTGNVTDNPVQFSYYVDGNTAPLSLSGFPVNGFYTKEFADQGRLLSLKNVYLGPIAEWSVYVSNSNGIPVTISNSTINEIAAFKNGIVNISNNVVLQLADLAAAGPGSQMNVANTPIWSSIILAQHGGHMNITHCQLHGNKIEASGSGSSITITGSTEDRNGTSRMSCGVSSDLHAGYPPNIDGVPLCNPQNPLGGCSQVVTASGGVVTGTPKCQ